MPVASSGSGWAPPMLTRRTLRARRSGPAPILATVPALAKRADGDAAELPAAFAGGVGDRAALLAAPLACLHRPSRLDRPLTDLTGVGEKLAAATTRIGLRTLGDLI